MSWNNFLKREGRRRIKTSQRAPRCRPDNHSHKSTASGTKWEKEEIVVLQQTTSVSSKLNSFKSINIIWDYHYKADLLINIVIVLLFIMTRAFVMIPQWYMPATTWWQFITICTFMYIKKMLIYRLQPTVRLVLITQIIKYRVGLFLGRRLYPA